MEEKVELKEEKQPKTTKELVLFILKIVGNVVFYAVILCLLVFSIMNINAGSKNGGFPNIFGKGFLSVQSNSMTRDGNLPKEYDDYAVGSFAKGDMLYVDVINSSNINSLEKGDVITFYDESINALNSHRIVYINKNADGTVDSFSIEGDYIASIQGVFNPEDSTMTSINYDLQQRGNVITFTADNMSVVKGKVTGVNYGGGKVVDNIQQNWLWYFVLPVAAFLLFEIFMVVRNIMDLKGAKQKEELAADKDAMMADLEAQKEEMRRQILAELAAQQAAMNAQTAPKEETPIETPQVEEVKEGEAQTASQEETKAEEEAKSE